MGYDRFKGRRVGASRPVRTSDTGAASSRFGGRAFERCPALLCPCLRAPARGTGSTRRGRNRSGPPNRKELAVDRATKKEFVTTLNGIFKGTSVVVVAHYSGL